MWVDGEVVGCGGVNWEGVVVREEERGRDGTYKTQMTVLLEIDVEEPLVTVPFCFSCWVAMLVRRRSTWYYEVVRGEQEGPAARCWG